VVFGSPLSPLLQSLGTVVVWLLWRRCSRCARRAVISSWSPGPFDHIGYSLGSSAARRRLGRNRAQR
jgi:hypothetical protein